MLRSERSLRRLVAELAEARSEDVEDVLAQLTPSQRPRIEALLADLAGRPSAPSPARAEAPSAKLATAKAEISFDGLSSGLIERLEAAWGASPSGGPTFSLTPAARESFKAAALKVQPPAELTEEGPPLATPKPGVRFANPFRRERA